jgi:hypothetical protein
LQGGTVPTPRIEELAAAEGYSHLWVTKPVMDILGGLAISMKEYPNIPPGQAFDGYK